MKPEDITNLRVQLAVNKSDFARLLGQVAHSSPGQWESSKYNPSTLKVELMKILLQELEERGGDSLRSMIAEAKMQETDTELGLPLIVRWLKEA